MRHILLRLGGGSVKACCISIEKQPTDKLGLIVVQIRTTHVCNYAVQMSLQATLGPWLALLRILFDMTGYEAVRN